MDKIPKSEVDICLDVLELFKDIHKESKGEFIFVPETDEGFLDGDRRNLHVMYFSGEKEQNESK